MTTDPKNTAENTARRILSAPDWNVDVVGVRIENSDYEETFESPCKAIDALRQHLGDTGASSPSGPFVAVGAWIDGSIGEEDWLVVETTDNRA